MVNTVGLLSETGKKGMEQMLKGRKKKRKINRVKRK